MRSTPNVDGCVLVTDDDDWSALHSSRWVMVFRYSIPLSLPFPPFLRYAAAEDGEERSADLRDHGYTKQITYESTPAYFLHLSFSGRSHLYHLT